MYVEDAVHSLVDDVVDDLMHSCHPLGLYFCADVVVCGVPGSAVQGEVCLHVGVPGNGNAYGVESCFFEHLKELWFGDGLPPCCFVVCGSATGPFLDPHVVDVAGVAVECVAEIPPYSHIGDG